MTFDACFLYTRNVETQSICNRDHPPIWWSYVKNWTNSSNKNLHGQTQNGQAGLDPFRIIFSIDNWLYSTPLYIYRLVCAHIFNTHFLLYPSTQNYLCLRLSVFFLVLNLQVTIFAIFWRNLVHWRVFPQGQTPLKRVFSTTLHITPYFHNFSAKISE